MPIDGCECVSAWSWVALGILVGVFGTLALAACMSARQFARAEHED